MDALVIMNLEVRNPILRICFVIKLSYNKAKFPAETNSGFVYSLGGSGDIFTTEK